MTARRSARLWRALAAGLTGCATLVPTASRAEWGLNFQRPVTGIASDLYDLHMLIFWICVVIFIGVFSVMFYSLFKHRKSTGHEAAKFHHSTRLEIVWTVIPTLILIAMAVPSTATLLRMEDTSDAELTVKITGYQWKWRYEYLDHGVDFFSNLSTPRAQIEGREEKGEHYLLEVDKHLVLPVGKKVRFLLTANDVIHAWWVPQLGVKKDAIPGFINEMWTRIDEPGTYRGQCAELCGKDHGFMPVVVDAVSEADFDAWIARQQGEQTAMNEAVYENLSMDDLMAQGEKVYAQCAACHGPNGEGVAGAFPGIAGSAVATGPLDQHVDVVLKGRDGTAMQAFAGQLNDADIAAVVTYQRNAFGNQMGDSVQAEQIRDRRAK